MKELAELLKLERLTIEQKIQAKDILLDLDDKIEGKEVYVKEPDDVSDDAKMESDTIDTILKKKNA